MRIFISHSSQDAVLAEALIELLRDSFRLPARDIRCTSVDGYRLPAGASTDEQLKREVSEAEAFIGIISPASLKSAYVIFELGARWGSGKHLAPLLAPGLGTAALEGPLRGINALRADSAAQLHQVVDEVAELLGLATESAAAYQKRIDRIVSLRSSQSTESGEEEGRTVGPVQPSSGRSSIEMLASADDEYQEAEMVIRGHCKREWPDDYDMQEDCEQKQREALAALRRGNPGDIPDEVFARIRSKAAAEWPNDYDMRLDTEEKQVAAYRRLSKR